MSRSCPLILQRMTPTSPLSIRHTLAITLLLLTASIHPTLAQRAKWSKMSSWVRCLAIEQSVTLSRPQQARGTAPSRPCELYAFVRLRENADSVLRAHHSRALDHCGDLYIAAIPLDRLGELSLSPQVERIEARRGSRALLDSVRLEVGAQQLWTASAPLTQAFTGRSVVVGVQDIGFDLTHPTFLDASGQQCRIGRLWDQLSTDTVGSTLPVGRDYQGSATLLALGHSRDGLIMAHGTHTAGIAAGNGYTSSYSGMAPESDLCLVANATSDNASLIDSADYYKYTYALDVLGFKYIFDYAESLGEPCVISFSEGSGEDLRGDDALLYAMLDSITGPGRIIVASAGNSGASRCYLHKLPTEHTKGTFLQSGSRSASLTLSGRSPYGFRLLHYGQRTDCLNITTRQVAQCKDSLLTDTLHFDGQSVRVSVAAFPSSFDPTSTALEVVLASDTSLWASGPIALEIVADTADVELYTSSFNLTANDANPALVAGQQSHSILSPSSAPSVISVGATAYRSSFENVYGQRRGEGLGSDGQRAWYSSVGPTYDGRTKPDVMAPGTNIISSYNSFFMEHNPQDAHLWSDVERFSYNGRTYAWNCNTGTSMSAPVVAGVIALWLQARPRLTPSDVLDVLRQTCSHPDPSLSYPNNYYGYGQIDAYRGLLHLLQLTGVKGLSMTRPSGLKFAVSHGVLTIDAPQSIGRQLSISIFTQTGAMVLRRQLTGERHFSIDLSLLPHGIYAVQADGGSKPYRGSTLIRL